MKFKNYIEAQSGIKDSADSPGTLDQVLTSTETGIAWVNPSTISAEAATLVVIECKNTSGATITKGTPVYQTGTVGATDVIEIAPADALISSGKQPAIGLLQTTLNNNGFGKVVITGEFLNFTTDPIDGVTPTTGDKVFLKSGGGLTLTKPTGAENGIQNLGLIGKVSGGNAGSITVSSIMRTNDVPNLPEGRIWVGDGNTIVSDTVYVDEPNNRVGIGTTDPYAELYVKSPVAQSINNDIETTTAGFVINGSDENMSLQFGLGGAALNYGNWIQSGYDNGTPGSSPLFLNPIGGNVGIGTTSPQAKLDVDGEVRTSSNFIADNSTLGSLSLRISGTETGRLDNFNSALRLINFHASSETVLSGNGDISLTSVGSNNIKFATANSERMRIDSSGNVGIGTTSPSEKLDVVGNIELNGVLYVGSRGIYQQQNTDVSGLELVANASINLYRAAFFDYVIQKQGNVRAGTVFACNDGASVEYTETSTNDIGDTSDVVLSVDISGTNMRLLADAATSGWSVKSLIRAI